MSADERPATRLKTRISEAYWCDPTDKYAFKHAKLSIARKPDEPVAWLDELFEGGISLPAANGGNQALCIVVSGPAGSGKSTLALELAYRWARHTGLTTSYVLTEAHARWIFQNVKSFGWKDGEAIFRAVDDQDRIQERPGGQVILTDNFRSLVKYLKQGVVEAVLAFFGELPLDNNLRRGQIVPDVIVVDSLNTVESTERKDIYAKLGKLMSSGVKIVVLIGDSSARGPLTEPWEFAADIVLRLDASYDSGGYLVRTIEIVKARYQPHVWGRHQLKLYGKPEEQSPSNRMRLRNHPYISQGGVFIYPSIHYILSRYKAMSPIAHGERDYLPSPLPPLTEMLGEKGFPRGRCTALAGDRGTHKSHLAYLQTLSGVLHPDDPAAHHKALIVSLRDDEGTTRATLARIVGELGAPGRRPTLKAGVDKVDELERNGDLEITFYPPGFITPEEFFHRLLLSINRLKAGRSDVHLSVLFNSLDQLSSRFPLCAQHKIFVPGIIQMLTAENITSYFVAGKDATAVDDYGLLSMAELILFAERKEMPKADYLSFLYSLRPDTIDLDRRDLSRWAEQLDPVVYPVQLRVERFAGGEPAGAYGVLELFEKETSRLFGRRGLEFIPSKNRMRTAADV